MPNRLVWIWGTQLGPTAPEYAWRRLRLADTRKQPLLSFSRWHVPPGDSAFLRIIETYSEPFSYALNYKPPELLIGVGFQLSIQLSPMKRYPYRPECLWG